MYYPKIYCEHHNFDPKVIGIILYNISTNVIGFIHNNVDYVIYRDTTQLKLLQSNMVNKIYEHEIIYSEDWVLMQRYLNKLKYEVTSNIIYYMKYGSKEILSIIDAVLSFPMNSDIKFIIMSNIFTNSDILVRISTVIDYKSQYLCVYFGGMCKYNFNLATGGAIIKKLIDYYVTTNMRKKIKLMCVFGSFTILMFNNLYSREDFTILIFNHDTNKVTMYPFCVNGGCIGNYYGYDGIKYVSRFINNMHECTIIRELNFNSRVILDIKSLIEKIKHHVQLFVSKFHAEYMPDDDLFY